MTHQFTPNKHFTIGVEVELGLVNSDDYQLESGITRILDQVPEKWNDCFKPEFMQSFCEINTGVCDTVADVQRDLDEKLTWANKTAQDLGLQFVWCGTHPFSNWADQKISPGDRYAWLLETMQHIARRLTVFGLHIHIGLSSGDKAIQMCDRLLRHLPTLLALSGNSPYWEGEDTGLVSYRSKVIEMLPTAGMPQTMRNWSEYVWLINHLISTGFIRSIREIWWDVRPHREFGTVEIRVMDQPLNMKHLLGLVALTQSLVAGISEDIDRGAYQFDCHPMIAKQNKWHATRYGMNASFVDSDTMLAIPAVQMSRRLVEKCTPFAEKLGCVEQLGYVEDIIANGNGADRQRKIFADTGELTDVVRFLVDEGRQAGV
ncbi:MAG: YbdK family carboxylate-amine ligase [Planctomycetota bacterium]|nr:YbdK family carboxylate-amine ligase [Planctomycetota bacterium]